MLFLSLLWLAGCAPTFSTPTTPTVPPATASPSETWPLTVTDDLDRRITIEARPERIVSLLPSNTEILFAVGAGPQVVGVTSYCNYPPEAADRPQIGGITNQAISIETIVSLEPDLVLASGSQNEIIPILAETGLTVIALKPTTFEDIQANIAFVGQVTGHADQANGIVADMRRRAEAIQTKVATVAKNERPTVFYEVWDEPLMTAGPRTYIGQMIELAGGRNIFTDVDQDWPQVSAELIVSRNPAVILGPASHAEALAVEQIMARPGWSSIAAVQNIRIYLLDSDMVSRPGPRFINILEEIARDLYPDLF